MTLEWNDEKAGLLEGIKSLLEVDENLNAIDSALAEIVELTEAHKQDGETIDELRAEISRLREMIGGYENYGADLKRELEDSQRELARCQREMAELRAAMLEANK